MVGLTLTAVDGEPGRANEDVAQEFELYREDLARALTAAEEACRHVAGGDTATACEVLGEASFQLEKARQDYLEIVKVVEEADAVSPSTQAEREEAGPEGRLRCDHCGETWDPEAVEDGQGVPRCQGCGSALRPELPTGTDRLGSSPEPRSRERPVGRVRRRLQRRRA